MEVPMSLGRPLARLHLEPEQREQLEAMASSRSLPHGLVTRVRIVLLSADGLSNKDIAARLRLNQVTVGLWRRRFVKQGLTGLHEELRPGRPPKEISGEVRLRVFPQLLCPASHRRHCRPITGTL